MTGASAQSMHGMTYNTGLTMGDANDYISAYSWRGVGFEGRYFQNSNLTIGWSFGWNTFYEGLDGSFENGTTTLTGKQYRYINTMPIHITTHYYFGEDGDVQPYIGAGVGTSWIEKRTDMGLYSSNVNKWHFSFAPEVGVIFPASVSSNFYISAKYNYAVKTSETMSYSYLGINVGFLWY